MHTNPQIEVTNLEKKFAISKEQHRMESSSRRYITAVDKLSFTVLPGEVFGLLGPNGAGKTTTLRLLSTLIKPDGGDATINGYSITNSSKKVRESIGFLTSELKLEETFSPDYLFDFFANLHHMNPEWAKYRKKQLFSLFEIEKYSHIKLAELSTGMKQITSLAVAIAHDPNVIIFDEPTNGLDLVVAKIVTDFISEMKRQSKTIILSTHLFNLAEKTCTKVGFIINGKIVFQNSLSSFNEKDTLEDIFFRIYNPSERCQ